MWPQLTPYHRLLPVVVVLVSRWYQGSFTRADRVPCLARMSLVWLHPHVSQSAIDSLNHLLPYLQKMQAMRKIEKRPTLPAEGESPTERLMDRVNAQYGYEMLLQNICIADSNVTRPPFARLHAVLPRDLVRSIPTRQT